MVNQIKQGFVMIDNVTQLELTRRSALKIIRELAEDSSKVIITHHARERMQQRNITDIQIFRCLLHGNMQDSPYRDPRGSWKMKLENKSAGDVVKVVIALDCDSNGNYIVVITTF